MLHKGKTVMQTYKLIEDNYVLLNQPKLIDSLGRTGAQFLCQIHYWIEQGCGTLHEGIQWIYNTEKEWGKQIRLSERQIRHYIKKLSEMGILIVKKLHEKKYDRTNHITINYDALNRLVTLQNQAQLHEEETASSKRKKLPHVYTKITNKDKNYKSKEGKGDFENKKDDLNNQVEPVKNNDLNEKKLGASSSFSEIGARKTNQSSSEKPTTIQDMITIWNEYFPKAESKLNKDLAKLLGGAFKQKFGSDLTLWKNYCKRIESSSYLMGEGFKLSLYWALKFTTIDRLLNGELGVKEIAVPVLEEALIQKAKAHIGSINESPLSLDVREKFLKVIGAASYLSWFTKVTFVEKGGVVNMKAETPFVEDYIKTHFGHLFNLRS
jgi:hypothetical protein